MENTFFSLVLYDNTKNSPKFPSRGCSENTKKPPLESLQEAVKP
jgi:hypothetical protein